MTTTLTPPPYGGSNTPPPPGAPDAPGVPPLAPPPRGSSRIVAIVAICVGGALLLGTAGGALAASLRAGAERSATLSSGTAGVEDLSVRVSGAEIEVVFGDVAQATLDVVGAGGADGWTLAVDDDELTVRYDREWWDQWRWSGERDRAVLTLPVSLRGLDASLAVDGGSLRADGDFADLDLELNAGALTVDGSARELDVEVNAGSAQVSLGDVSDATVSVSAGQLTGDLTGRAPASVSIDVSAGRVDLTVPDESYAVTSDVSAGNFTNELTVDPSATRRVDVTVSAGSTVLRAG